MSSLEKARVRMGIWLLCLQSAIKPGWAMVGAITESWDFEKLVKVSGWRNVVTTKIRLPLSFMMDLPTRRLSQMAWLPTTSLKEIFPSRKPNVRAMFSSGSTPLAIGQRAKSLSDIGAMRNGLPADTMISSRD